MFEPSVNRRRVAIGGLVALAFGLAEAKGRTSATKSPKKAPAKHTGGGGGGSSGCGSRGGPGGERDANGKCPSWKKKQ